MRGGVYFLIAFLVLSVAAFAENTQQEPPAGTLFPDSNGEPGNLIFYEGPWEVGETESALYLATPSDIAGHGVVNLSFNMTVGETDGEGPFGGFSLRNLCSHMNIAGGSIDNKYTMKQRFVARGIADNLVSADFEPEEGETYFVRVSMQTNPARSILDIYDSDENNVVNIENDLNSNPENEYTLDQTKEGFMVMFFSDLEPVPAGWVYSDISVDVQASTGSNPLGGELGTPEGRLAFLAANMAQLPQGDDYSLDCGPASEVLPIFPGDASQPYCVLRYDDEIIFGTAGTTQTFFQSTFSTFQSDLFAAQIDPSEIRPDACGNILNSLETEFADCNEGSDGEPIPGFNTYGYLDPIDASQAAFILVSQNPIDGLETTVLESVVDFFRGLFGLPPSGQVGGLIDPGTTLPLQKFHHAFLAKEGDKTITATWYGDNAVLAFNQFKTDFSSLVPEDDDNIYTLSDQGQVMMLELNRQNTKDWMLWRQLTSGVTIGAGSGSVIAGDTCGNGILGLTEQCEPGVSEPKSCDELGFLSEDSADCLAVGDANECTYDLTDCGYQEGLCLDDWTPPPPLPDVYGCAGEYYCKCNGYLWDVLQGNSLSSSALMDAEGVMGSSGASVLASSRQNIPVICGAAVYLQEGEDYVQWWIDYFNAQKGEGNFMGTDIMSPVYSPSVVASVMSVLAESKTRGHTDIQQAAEEWLQAYWAIAALSGVDSEITEFEVIIPENPYTGIPNDDYYEGYTVASAGAKTRSDSLPSQGTHLLLSLALGKTTSYDIGDVFGPGRQLTPIGNALTVAGFPPEDGDVVWDDVTQPIPSEIFGLTDEQRTALNNTVSSSAEFETLKAMVGDRTPVVPMTFIRSSTGVVTWLGTFADLGTDSSILSEETPVGKGLNPNENMPPYYAVKMLNTGETTVLFAHDNDTISGAVSGDAGRFGSEYCAKVDGTVTCLDFSVVEASGFELIAQWVDGGLNLIEGNLTSITHNAQGIWTGNPGANTCSELSSPQFINPQTLYSTSCDGGRCIYCEDESIVSYLSGTEELTFIDLTASAGSCPAGYTVLTRQEGYNICKKPVTIEYAPGEYEVPVMIDIRVFPNVPDPNPNNDEACAQRMPICNEEGVRCRAPAWIYSGQKLHCAAIKTYGLTYMPAEPSTGAGYCQTVSDCPFVGNCIMSCNNNLCEYSNCVDFILPDEQPLYQMP